MTGKKRQQGRQLEAGGNVQMPGSELEIRSGKMRVSAER